MSNRKSSGLLWKSQRKFPDENDGCIYEERKCTLLKFTGEIAADPRVRTQDRPIPLRPTARHVGKHRQHRQFIIVVPKKQRIVPEQDEAEADNE